MYTYSVKWKVICKPQKPVSPASGIQRSLLTVEHCLAVLADEMVSPGAVIHTSTTYRLLVFTTSPNFKTPSPLSKLGNAYVQSARVLITLAPS